MMYVIGLILCILGLIGSVAMVRRPFNTHYAALGGALLIINLVGVVLYTGLLVR